jgi:hypothetical protein
LWPLIAIATRSGMPALKYARIELFDAFENRGVEAFTEDFVDNDASRVYCWMENEQRERLSSSGCDKVSAYVEHLMSQ